MRAHEIAIGITLLVILSVDGVKSLKCHEGINMTVLGSIPFYLWTENTCEDGSICFIQEVSKKGGWKLTDFTVRYGGCFPKGLQNSLTCSDREACISIVLSKYLSCCLARGDNINFKFMKGIAEIIDQKILSIALKVALDRKSWGKLFSRGNDINEFFDGFLAFLETVGYPVEKVRPPFKKMVQNYHRTGFLGLIDGLYDLLKAMKVENRATKHLSSAIRQRIQKYSGLDEMDDIFENTVDILPGLAYPLVKCITEDADRIFTDIADAMQSQEKVLTEKDAVTLVYAQFFMVFFAISVPEYNDAVYRSAKELSTFYSKVYPNDFDIEMAGILLDTIQRYRSDIINCVKGRDRNCRERLKQDMIEYAFTQVNLEKDWNDTGGWFDWFYGFESSQAKLPEKFVRSANDLTTAFHDAVRESKNPALGGWGYATAVQKCEYEIKKFIFLFNKYKPSRKDLDVDSGSCKEHICSTNFCNSHFSIRQEHGMKDSTLRKAKIDL